MKKKEVRIAVSIVIVVLILILAVVFFSFKGIKVGEAVGGGAGGSGGGVSAGTSISTGDGFEKKVWTSISASTSFELSNDTFGITRISFDVTEIVYGAWLKVEKNDSFPISIKNFSDKVYKRLELVKGLSLKDEVVKNIKIDFKVEKQWLIDNELANNQISLFRYANEEWVELPTVLSNDDETYVYYSADTPGFSYFIIGENREEPDITPPAIVFISPEDNSIITKDNLTNIVVTKKEAWKVDKTYKKLEMANNDKSPSLIEGETIRDISNFIDEEELKVLSDETWNIYGLKYPYQQFLFFDSRDKRNEIVKYDESDDEITSDFFYVKSNGQIAFYKLEFASTVPSKITDSNEIPNLNGTFLTDFEGTQLNILGKEYTVVSARRLFYTPKDSIALTLMTGPVKDTLLESKFKTYTFDGKEYKVSLLFVSETKAQFIVNGETTSKLEVGGTFVLADGIEIGVSDISYQNFVEGIRSAEFFLGVDKLILRDNNITQKGGMNLKVSSEDIDGTEVIITGTDDNKMFTISTIEINMTADDDYWVPANGKLSEVIAAAGDEKEVLMNGLLDIKYHGLTEEITHNIKLRALSNDKYGLIWYDGDNNQVNMPVAYAEAEYNLSLGAESWPDSSRYYQQRLILKESAPIWAGDFFVVTGGNPEEGTAKSYLLQYKGADNLNKEAPKIKFRNIGGGELLEFDLGRSNPRATINLSDFSFIVENASSTTTDDFQIFVDLDTTPNHVGIGEEQVSIIDSYGSQWSFDWDVDRSATPEDQDYINITQTTPNEEDYDNFAPSNLILSITATSGPEVRADLYGYTLITPDGETGVKYGYTSMGAFVTHHEPNAGPDEFTLTYPEKQRLPQVYITGKTETVQQALQLKVSTDENAVCSYKVGSDEEHLRMDETDGTSHLQNLFNLQENNMYQVSIQCADKSKNLNTKIMMFNFSEPKEELGGFLCPKYSEGIVVHKIDSDNSASLADNTYENGWNFNFFVTVPEEENNITLWVNDWVNGATASILQTEGNIRILYNNSVYRVGSAQDYSNSNSFITVDKYPSCPGRQIEFKVLAKLPENTDYGYYSTSYGIRSRSPKE